MIRPDGSSSIHPIDIEYLARIEYEAQMKSAGVDGFAWAAASVAHKEIARAGIRAVLETLESWRIGNTRGDSSKL